MAQTTPHPLVTWTWPTARLRLRGPRGVEEMLEALEKLLQGDNRLLMRAAGGRVGAGEVLAAIGPTADAMLCIGLGLCLRGRLPEGAGWLLRASQFEGEISAACAVDELRHLEDVDVIPLPAIMPPMPTWPDKTALALVHRGQALYAEGAYDYAAMVLSAAVNLTDAMDDEGDLALSAEANYGEALRASGRHKEAAAVLLPLLEDMRELLEPNHEDLVATLQNLVACYLDVGNLGPALPLIEEWLAGTNEGTVEYFRALYRKAWTLSRMQAAQDAWPLYQQVLLGLGEQIGHESAELVAIWHDMGQSAGEAGNHALAGQALRRALELAESNFGLMHPETGSVHLSLGTLYWSMERYDECATHWSSSEMVLGAFGDAIGRPAWEASLQLYRHRDDLQNMARVLRRLAEVDSQFREELTDVERQLGESSL
jgi:tetratricopeptide (TPR) repeat protein